MTWVTVRDPYIRARHQVGGAGVAMVTVLVAMVTVSVAMVTID